MQESPPTEPVREVTEARQPVFLIAVSLWMNLLAAGPLLVASVLVLVGLARPPALFARVAPSLSLAFAGMSVLLWIVGYGVAGQRRHFRTLWILSLFSADAFMWLFWGVMRPMHPRMDLAWSGLIVSMLLAAYPSLTGGPNRNELWPRVLLFPHLAAHAFLAGSALLVLALAYFGGSRTNANVLLRCVLGGICAHGALVLLGIGLARRNRERAPAVWHMLSGPLAARFWILAVLMGTALPIYILVFHFARPDLSGLWGAIAATLAMLGLLVYEDCCAGAARGARSS